LNKHLNDERGEDIFIASATAMKNEDTEELWTYAVWPRGIETLVPALDRVALDNSQTDEITMKPWIDVLADHGDLLEPQPDLWPPRWRTRGFPELP
ncbi:MAG: hypothetical protein AAF078_07285, partial [Planctomycetota bacterium]